MAGERECGSCTLCCKLLAISELDKPKDRWCPHCAVGKGCTIYVDRPTPCRTFQCGYMIVPDVAEHWFPARSKMVLASEMDGRRLVIHVDPVRPGAWREQPYFAEIKAWARKAAPAGDQIWVMTGNRLTIVFPDGEIDLGTVSAENGVLAERRNTPTGPRWFAEKIAPDDPRIAAQIAQTKS